MAYQKEDYMKYFFRYISVLVVMNVLKIFWLFKMDYDRIMFICFGGKQYADSPYYLSKYIQKQYSGKKLQWVLYDRDKIDDEKIEVVNPKSISFLRSFCTAGTIITNDTIRSFLPIRKNQILLQTWHGGGAGKTIGFADPISHPYDKYQFKLNDNKTTVILSGSSFCSNIVLKKSLGYFNTPIWETGLPRNDSFFEKNEYIRKKIFRQFNIDSTKGIVLYAPTYRSDSKNGFFIDEKSIFSVEEILDSLKNRFQKEFVLLFRAHHIMDCNNIPGAISVTEYQDMQELLCVTDVLITDYSSCMHDFSLMKKVVFLYVPDIDEYTNEHSFYWPIQDLPFPYAKSVVELQEVIRNFDEESYQRNVTRYLNKLGNFEKGDSTEKVLKKLEDMWKKQYFIEGNRKDGQ